MENNHVNDPLRAEAQARLAAIVESSDDAIVSKTLDGVIVTWNAGAERIFGYTADEVVGKSITIIIPPDRLQEEPEILSRLRAGQRVDHFETIRRRKDGRLINVSVTISPVRNAAGTIVGVSKVARDITLQKQFESELQAARQEAERAKRIAEDADRSKDHFLGMLSHELRTPLTPILAAAEVMEQSTPPLPEELREQVAMIQRNAQAEARLVDDLLDLTRISRGMVQLHFEVVDAHAAIRDAIALFQTRIDAKSLTVAVTLRAKQFSVWADPVRFQQILANLLSNAVKFTPESGTITIRSSNANGTVKIEVADSGIGIEHALLARLFEPFQQGDQTLSRRFGGLGLGLSIVKALVELHKGSITASSEGHDKGATFTLRVEVVQPASALPVSASVAAAPKGYRVLLVEDHHDTRNAMTSLLRSFGCVVTPVGSVKEALEAADRESFDLLMSDIGLPDGTGFDVMRHLRDHHGVRGIALSGYGHDDDVRRSREAGFEAHLIKPINFKTLHEAIKKTST